MASVELNPSAAVQLAWKVAAAVARATGPEIDLPQFLYGIFSLENLPPEQIPADKRDEVEEEVAALQRVLATADVAAQDVRRRIRAEALSARTAAAATGAMSRSDAVKQAFEQAAVRGQVGLLRTSKAMLAAEPRAMAWVGVEGPAFAQLIVDLEGPKLAPIEDSDDEMSLEGMSIFHSLDAEQVADPKVDWSVFGEHFGALCEMTWGSMASAKIEPLLEASVQILLKAIPAAEQASFMMLDAAGGLLLKAHAPRGKMPVSTSSARKAIETRASFIWQRGEDLSASQLASDLRAGLYAPVIAGGEVFGVLCLDANSDASSFSREDLFLATSFGHQIGLTLANRRREDDLVRTAKLMERLLTNFSPKVRDRLMLKAQAGRLKLGGERSVISVLCSDIRGFTVMTADMDTEEVVNMLNEYFTAMVAVVFKHGGSVDKFIGDAIMAVFGSPEADSQHAENSTRAALEMQSEIDRVSAQRERAGLPACRIGIGVHTGEVIHGFIGSQERMEFTVIGAAVNMAARYCDAAKGGEVILSAEMLERVWKEVVVEPREVPTKHEGTLAAYRLISMKNGR